MLTEGQLVIELTQNGAQDNLVAIDSTRPVAACKILVGKSVEEAFELVPRLFNLCGMAQSRAASLAITNQSKQPTDVQTENARDMLVLIETAREHLLQLLLTTPKIHQQQINPVLLDGISSLPQQWLSLLFAEGAFQPQARSTADARDILQAIENLEKLLTERVFQCSPESWLELSDETAIHQWSQQQQTTAATATAIIYQQQWAQQGDTYCQAMPRLDVQTLDQLITDVNQNFAAEPLWQNRPLETTTLSRNQGSPLIQSLTKSCGNGLLTRWIARLVDLAQIPQHLRQIMESNEQALVSCEHGIAQVEAARGRLIHRVRLEGETISEYQIVAPTEWNFHPRGVVSRCLASLRARSSEQLEQLCRLLISSIDPCVGYQLRIQ